MFKKIHFGEEQNIALNILNIWIRNISVQLCSEVQLASSCQKFFEELKSKPCNIS